MSFSFVVTNPPSGEEYATSNQVDTSGSATGESTASLITEIDVFGFKIPFIVLVVIFILGLLFLLKKLL